MVGVAGKARAQSPDWSVTLMAPAFPSPYISEWERNPQNLALVITYIGQSPREYRVVGTLRESGRGELARAESPLLSIAPGPITVNLTANELSDWRVVGSHPDDVEVALRSGVVPEGDYEICARLLSPSHLELAESCAPLTIVNPERPELLFPLFGDPVSISQPTFQWTPVVVPPSLGVTYRVRVVERLRGQAPRTAMNANRIHFETEVSGAPMLVYPVDALPLEVGKEYVWQVEALDGMGQPLAAGGLQSELWTFTYRGGFSDLIGELDLDEAGLPSELALVPGLARLVGLGGIETESSPFGVRLNGPATLELEGAYAGQVRVRLQDLEVEVVGGQLQVRGGRVIGDLPAGLIPLSGGRASEYLQAERIEFTRERGLLVEAALALPGTDQIRMSGEAHLTLAGVYGYLEASGRPGEPLLRIGGEPVALQVERAGVRLPQGDLDLVSRVELFGFESPCDEVYADINEDGVWESGFGCAGELSLPLADGLDRARISVYSVAGGLAFALDSGVLDHSLDLNAMVELDAGASSTCGASFGMHLEDGQVEIGDLIPRCGNGTRSELDWLDLGLSNLRIERIEWLADSGFELEALIDLAPSIPELPDLRLPLLEDVVVGTEGLRIPSIDQRVGPLALSAGGFGLRVTRVRSPGFELSWEDWEARRTGSASFGLDAELSIPRLGSSAPQCLTSRAPATSVELAAGRLSIELEDRSFSPGDCLFNLADGIDLEVTEISGGVELALAPELGLERMPTVRGSLSLPEIFRCAEGDLDVLGSERGARRMPLTGGVSLGPEGELRGRIDGLTPPCPLGIAGLEVEVTSASLEFGGEVDDRSLVLSGGGRANFAFGDQPVGGSGELELDLIRGELIGGALEFSGPLAFDLPREEPLLSFRLGGARLDREGLRIDGRNQLVLPDGETIRATFDEVVFDPAELKIRSGRILFDRSFALEVGVSDLDLLLWGAVAGDAPLQFETGARVELPSEVWIDSAGLGVSGDGSARLMVAGNDLGELGAQFREEFALSFEPVRVEEGRIEISHEGVPLVSIDRSGFHLNTAYMTAAILPERLGIPSASVAYLQLRDSEGELMVETETVGEGGVRIYTRAGERVPLVIPALQFERAVAPEIEVGFDLTLDPLGDVIAGGVEAAVPAGQESLFDLGGRGLPFAIDSLVYTDHSGDGHELILAGQLQLPGGLTDGGVGRVRLGLDRAGRLRGDFDLETDWEVDLVPEYMGDAELGFAFAGLEGMVDIDLTSPSTGKWQVELGGALELALGAGDPYRVTTRLLVGHTGFEILEFEPEFENVTSLFDLAGVRLGISNLRLPHLEYDELLGWDFEFGIDLAFEFPEFGGIEIPSIPDVRLSRSGLTIPDIQVPELNGKAFELAGFELRALAFRMDSLHLDPFGGFLPDEWGLAFDFELGFGELPEWAPAALSNLKLSILDAGYINGRLTGSIETRGLTPGSGIEIPLGDLGMALNLLSIGGELLEEGGEQEIRLTTTASWELPEFLSCDAVDGPVPFGDATLTIDSRLGVSGVVSDLVPACPLTFGPLALQALESDLIFEVGPDGQGVILDLEGRLELPTFVEGERMVVDGALAIDLLDPRIVRGGIDVREPFRWGLPIENPFLTFAVTEARLDERGFVFSGDGAVRVEDGVDLGVAFNQLAFALPSLEVVGGSASFEGGFALDATIDDGLRWMARPGDAPRPSGSSLRLLVPDQARLDLNGLTLAGTGSGELTFQDSVFAALGVEFDDGFRLAFEPVGVEEGRAGFILNGTEIAYLDQAGFHPGDIFGLVPVPARIGLPNTEVAYLQLRDPETDELLVETEQVEGGLRLGTRSGSGIDLVVPALAAPGAAPPAVRTSFEIIVDSRTFVPLSGGVSVAASEEAKGLFGLDSIGLPLDVRRLAFEDPAGDGYELRFDARVRLPGELAGLDLDLEDIVISAEGLKGEVLVGSYRTSAGEGGGPLATFGTESLELQILGTRVAFGAEPEVELHAGLLMGLFADADGERERLELQTRLGLDGVDLKLDTDGIRGGTLPIGLATFTPETLSDEYAPIEVQIREDAFRVRLGGVLRLPSLNEDLALTIDGLEVGTDGVRMPTLGIDLEQEFELFGAVFRLLGSDERPALALEYAESVLALNLSGELEFLKHTTRFEGLRLATDGSISVDELCLVCESVEIVPEVLSLDQIRIREERLEADLGIVLPEPFDEAGRQGGTIRVGLDGSVSGAIRANFISEDPGLGPGKTVLGTDPVNLHIRYLGAALDFDLEDNGGIELVADLYLGNDSDNRVKLGDLSGNHVEYGMRIGFDGGFSWGKLTLVREEGFVFDFDVVRIELNDIGLAEVDNKFQASINGAFSVDLPSVSGGLKFEHLIVTQALEVELGEVEFEGGHLKIAETVGLEVTAFEYSNTPRDIVISGGGMPDGESGSVETEEETITVSTYLRLGGGIDLLGMSGGVEEFLFYRTTDGLTTLVIREATIAIENLLDLTADFRYATTSDGFEMHIAASVTAEVLAGAGGTLVGMIEKGSEVRAGLFVALHLPDPGIPLVPGALFLNGVGGGFFYNARQEHLDLVYRYANVPGHSTNDLIPPPPGDDGPGKFTGLLYAGAVVVSSEIAQARVLLEVSESHLRLAGRMGLLSLSGDLDAARIRGDLDLNVGFGTGHAYGNFQLVADFDPLLTTPDPMQLTFFVYGSDAWGIYGGGSLEYLKFIEGSGEFFVGPDGFLVSLGVNAGFDFWIVEVDGYLEGTTWFLVDEKEVGGFMMVGVEVGLLGGVVSGSAELRGAVLLAANERPYVYAGAQAQGCAAIVGCATANIWAKFAEGKVTGGFGYDPALDEIIARANSARGRLMASAEAMKEVIAEARPATITMSDTELAEMWENLQTMTVSEVRSVFGEIKAAEWDLMGAQYLGAEYYADLERFREMYDNYDAYTAFYTDLAAQVDAPTPSGSLTLEAYADSVAALIATIEARQDEVNRRVEAIELRALELRQLADEPWPESPVRSISIADAELVTITEIVDGKETKKLISGPGFDIDANAAAEARAEIEERERLIEEVAEQVREQIEALEEGVGSLQELLTARDEGSILAFSELHADAIMVAEEQYARQGDYLLRMQDWYEEHLAWFPLREILVDQILEEQVDAVRLMQRGGPADLAQLRAEALAQLGKEGNSILANYERNRMGVPSGDEWFRDQAIAFGKDLWFNIASAGMEEAKSKAEAEFDWIVEESQRRLTRLYALHMGLTRHYHGLYTEHAELIGVLYDFYDRYGVWLEELEDQKEERERVASRMEELRKELEVPDPGNSFVVSVTESDYISKEEMFWHGRHPSSSGVYENLFYVDQPEREFLVGLEALLSAILGQESGSIYGLTTNGPGNRRTRFILSPERGTKSIDRTARLASRGGAGFFGLKSVSYESVFRDGRSGKSTASFSESVVDRTPPTTPVVSFPDHTGGEVHWFSGPDDIQVRWRSTDPETGVGEYVYAIGRKKGPAGGGIEIGRGPDLGLSPSIRPPSPSIQRIRNMSMTAVASWDTTGVREWTSVQGRESVNLSGLQVDPASEYMVFVRARNGQGLWSDIGSSVVLRYDPTPPTFAEGAELKRQKSLSAFTLPAKREMGQCLLPHEAVGVSVFVPPSDTEAIVPEVTFYRPAAEDRESGVHAYYYRLTTDGPAAFEGPQGWTEMRDGTDEIRLRGEPLEFGKEFYLNVVAVNNANEASEVISESFTLYDPTPPESPNFCVAQSTSGARQGLSLTFYREAHDPETGIADYDYQIRTVSGDTIRPWSDTPWYEGSVPLYERIPLSPRTPQLRDRESYIVDIRARNGVGQETVVSSEPFRVDFTPPPDPVVDTIVRESTADLGVFVPVMAPGAASAAAVRGAATTGVGRVGGMILWEDEEDSDSDRDGGPAGVEIAGVGDLTEREIGTEVTGPRAVVRKKSSSEKLVARVTLSDDPESGLSAWMWEVVPNTTQVIAGGELREGELFGNIEPFTKRVVEIRLDGLGLDPDGPHLLRIVTINEVGLMSRVVEVLFNANGQIDMKDALIDGFRQDQITQPDFRR